MIEFASNLPNCCDCGARLSVEETNHFRGLTIRKLECRCGSRFESEETVTRRLPPVVTRAHRQAPVTTGGVPVGTGGHPPPPVGARTPPVGHGGVGGALPSGSESGSDSGPISPASPIRGRAQSIPRATLDGPALCRAFGAIRCELLQVGLPWQGVRTDHAKAADMAERISVDPGAAQDYQATIRLFFGNAKAGKYDRSADMLRDPAFAFGAWCSKFTALREELHGQQPAAPVTPEERQRAEARDRAARASAAAVAATDKKLAELRAAGARATRAPSRGIGIVTADGAEVDVAAVIAELADGKAVG